MHRYEDIKNEANTVIKEFLEKVELKKGSIFIIGCSTSEVSGDRIGKNSSEEIAKAIYDGIFPELNARGIHLAAQCCEHLNRAIIIEREAMQYDSEIVNVVPVINAGGAFSKTVYENSKDPVAIECVRADAGMDIGDTLIGMHLKKVAVPVRLAAKRIGNGYVVCARTRAKFVGGERAQYDSNLIGQDVRAKE